MRSLPAYLTLHRLRRSETALRRPRPQTAIPHDPRSRRAGAADVPVPAVRRQLRVGLWADLARGHRAAEGLAVRAGLRARPASRAPDATTPYDYVESVEHYLQHGFTLQREPAGRARTRSRPSCSRPARLLPAVRGRDGAAAADGRRAGAGRRRVHPRQLQRSDHQWVVSDIDAHAWVEAWFPSYGWVRFDPTPGRRAGARRHIALTPIQDPGVGQSLEPDAARARTVARRPGRSTPGGRSHGGGGFAHAVAIVRCSRSPPCCSSLALRATVRLREPQRERAAGRARAGARALRASRSASGIDAGRARAALPRLARAPPATSARCGWPGSRRRRAADRGPSAARCERQLPGRPRAGRAGCARVGAAAAAARLRIGAEPSPRGLNSY